MKKIVSVFRINNCQSGITMLFSIMVMSGVSIITITVGFFAIQELKAARAVILAEPAIISAESAGEAGLWDINRGTVLPDCSSEVSRELLQGSRTLNTRCLAHSSAIFNIKSNEIFSFFLYDPADLNGNLNPGYNWITVTHKSGPIAATARVERVDDTLVSSTSISPGNTIQIDLPNNPTDDNRFNVILTSVGNATLEVNTNRGMPDFPTLNTEGCAAQNIDPNSCLTGSQGFKRKLQILVPK